MAKSRWTGKKLSNRYLIDEMLGQGGMSAVYKATDPNLKRVVAVKMIHTHLSDNPDFVKRFEEELRQWRSCVTRVSFRFTTLTRMMMSVTWCWKCGDEGYSCEFNCCWQSL